MHRINQAVCVVGSSPASPVYIKNTLPWVNASDSCKYPRHYFCQKCQLVWFSRREAAGTTLRTAVPAVGLRVLRFRLRLPILARASGAPLNNLLSWKSKEKVSISTPLVSICMMTSCRGSLFPKRGSIPRIGVIFQLPL